MALMKNKSVSFNMENASDSDLLQWAESQKDSFSVYVKKLIDWDRKQRSRPVIEGQPREWKVPPKG
jgi:hypothetical protein